MYYNIDPSLGDFKFHDKQNIMLGSKHWHNKQNKYTPWDFMPRTELDKFVDESKILVALVIQWDTSIPRLVLLEDGSVLFYLKDNVLQHNMKDKLNQYYTGTGDVMVYLRKKLTQLYRTQTTNVKNLFDGDFTFPYTQVYVRYDPKYKIKKVIDEFSTVQ